MRVGVTALLLANCATMATAPVHPALMHETSAVEPSAFETRLVAEARTRHLAETSPLDAALIASGVRTDANLAAARAQFHEQIDPLLAEAMKVREPDARGRRLLELLFEGTRQRAMLAAYEVQATTLLDVLETGHFDCVSATLVYVLAAEAIGLDVHPVFLPSHARAAVTLPFGDVRVETTTPGGFDPDPASLRSVALRFNGEETAVALYDDEAGTDGDFLSLLGVVYVNSAALASSRAEHELSARLTERAEAFFPQDRLNVLRMVRASQLNAIAVQAFHAKKLESAFDLMAEAASIAPEGEVRKLVEGNLLAVADTRINGMNLKIAGADDAMLAFADRLQPWPEVSREVHALAWTNIADARRQRGDAIGAQKAAKEAAAIAADPETRRIASLNVYTAEVNRLGKLAESDPEKAWVEFGKLKPPGTEPGQVALQKQASSFIASQRAAAAANDGQCDRMDAAIRDWEASGSAAETDRIRSICHEVRGISLLSGQNGYAAALGELREAYRLNPNEAVNRTNFTAALERSAIAASKSGNCTKATAYVREGLAVEPTDEALKAVARRCGK